MFNDEKLVKKYGSWIRVQVHFYDFIFKAANEICASCFNSNMNEISKTSFADGDAYYETAVDAIAKTFVTFDDAWKAFLIYVDTK